MENGTAKYIVDEQLADNITKDRPIIDSVTSRDLINFSVKRNREPYAEFPNRLPTFDKNPLPVDEHTHIGQYESKQTLYLTIAHAYNSLMKKYEELEQRVKNLEDKV